MVGQEDAVGDATVSPEQTEQSDNLSADDLIAQRLGDTGTEEPEAEQEEPEGEPPAEEVEEEAEPEVDMDGTLSEDELRILESVRSRVPKRIAQLTARAKAAEEKLQQLETRTTNPLETPKPPGDNPYRELSTVESLRAKYAEVAGVIEWAEEVLEENDGADSDEEVTEIGGKPLTKAEVRSTLKRARKAKEESLPARYAELQAAEQRTQLGMQFDELAAKELPWMADEESEVSKEFQKIVSDPRVQAIKDAVPDIAPQLSYILAHFANSRFGSGATKPATNIKPMKPKAKPPSNQLSSAAAAGNPDAGRAKQLADLEKRFNETGSPADLQALRTLQHST